MFTSIQSFSESWKQECESTQKLLDALTDASLAQQVTPQDRTLGRIAWHIVTSLHDFASPTGLEFEAPGPDAAIPSSAQAIADSYRKASGNLADAVAAQWTDASLQEVRNVFGFQWPNGLTLSLLKDHQIHHRGQMTVLMRQAGLRVPGVYGPAREEWAEMNMEAPAL
ncbi:DinB family protein [Paenibacillus alkalitolerans]|uniref:DinB family protein n=1 Tax=Paenibacillus alkalitolerans TaxID=2799335 RepID=UPI0018F65A61|nr:DinB family protein [Paenibacillus alkalitolerans]